MPFVFDATEGGANANSFCTVEFFDDYFAGSLYADEAIDADLATKQKALVTATRDLNRLDYQGERTNWDEQALQFPRVSLEDRDGNFLDHETNPLELKEATCEQALFRLQQNPDNLVDESLKQFKRLKILNVLDMEMKDGTPTENTICERAMELISRWLLVSGGTTRIVRA